jgi:hypothetical protein
MGGDGKTEHKVGVVGDIALTLPAFQVVHSRTEAKSSGPKPEQPSQTGGISCWRHGSLAHCQRYVYDSDDVEIVADWPLQGELEEPLVADALGKIYNKAALLEFLLAPPPSPDVPVSTRPFGGDGLLAAGHLRSLKDVQTLKLTPATSNAQQSIASASNAESGGQVEFGKARWECPITMRGMNGAIKFVYIKGCGCVASEVGLKEVAGTQSPSSDADSADTAKRAVCPICAAKLPGSTVELVTLNPVGEEKAKMASAWAEKVAKEEKEKADKKAAKKKKRKGVADDEDAEKEAKKAKTAQAQPAPSINRNLPSMPETKKPVSKAIASLYSRPDGKDKLSPLFSSGYSRFA